MDSTFWVIGVSIIGGIFFAIQQATVTQPGKQLASKFVGLGELKGKTKGQIIKVVGQPSSFSVVGPEQTLLQWQATGYHIALSFTGDICNGVTHEHMVK